MCVLLIYMSVLYIHNNIIYLYLDKYKSFYIY